MTKLLRALSIALLLFVGVHLNAQHPRMVLMEEFTSSTCGPCAVYKPNVDEFAKTDNVVTVTYHQDYPAEGDPYNVLDATSNRTRHDYYGLQSIPHVFIDGKEANIASAAAIASAAQADLKSTSPLLITVTEDRSATPYKVNVVVRNDGTDALAGKVLQVMVVNYYSDLSKYPAVLNNPYTQYNTFDYCFLKAFPTIAGTTTSFPGNGTEQKYNFTYNPGADKNLWSGYYVVAFIQDPTTKTVYQAGTDFESITRKVAIQSDDPVYQITPRSKSIKKTFTLSNDMAVPQTASVALAYTSTVPSTWTQPTVSAPTVSIPPKSTVSVSVDFDVSTAGGSMFNSLVVTPTSGGISIPTKVDFGYVAENTKVCVLTQSLGDTPGDAYTQIAALAGYRNEVAPIPAKFDIFSELSSMQFDAVIVPIDFAHRTAYVTDEFASITRSLFESGTRMFFQGDAAFSNAMYSGNPSVQWDNFFSNLGITGIKTYPPLARFTQSGNTITPKTFGIKGTTGDPIGDKISLNVNTGTSSIDFYTEDLTYTSGVNSIMPIFSYSDVAASTAGIRLETDNARAVILGFNIDGIGAVSSRSVLYQKIMSWLVAKPDLSIQVTSADTLEFGTVEVKQAKTMTAVFQNTGLAPLTISDIQLPSSSGYTLTWLNNQITLPFTIAAGAKQNINLSLTANTEGELSGMATVISNAQSAIASAGASTFYIHANASTSQSVNDALSSDGALSVHLSPNPVVSSARLELSNNTAVARVVEARLVDERGTLVQTLLTNETLNPGTRSLPLDVRALASGSYRLMLRSATSAVSLPIIVTK